MRAEDQKRLSDLLAELDAKELEELRRQLFEQDDLHRLRLIVDLIAALSPEFREEIMRQLIGLQEDAHKGEVKLTVKSKDGNILIEFDRLTSWIGLPHQAAIRFAILILEHCGGTVERTITTPDKPV